MSETRLNFKEQIAEARRTQILMGAAQVFSEKGFHRATTKEIAQAAEVSTGTIYNYFNNKRDLLLAMMELFGARSLKTIIQSEPAADPREFLIQTLHDFYQLLQERGQFAAPILAEIFADEELRQALYQQIALPIVHYIDGYIRTHTYSGQLRRGQSRVDSYALIGAVVLNFVLKATHLDPDYQQLSADAMIEQLVALILDGLRTGDELVWLTS